MANQFLGLALFIMLLSFFIVLNAMSNFEESVSSRVLDSLSVTFSEQPPTPDIDANIEEDPTASIYDGDTLQRLERLFQSQITGVKMKKDRMGTMMQLRMPLDEFERQVLRGGGGGQSNVNLSSALVSLLASAGTVQYHMEILTNIDSKDGPAEAQTDNPAEVRKKVRRTALYAKVLEEAGLPKNFVTPGLSRGPEGTIDLVFRRYKAFDPFGKNDAGQQQGL